MPRDMRVHVFIGVLHELPLWLGITPVRHCILITAVGRGVQRAANSESEMSADIGEEMSGILDFLTKADTPSSGHV